MISASLLLMIALGADVPPVGPGQTSKALIVKQQSGSGGTMHFSTSVELSIDGGAHATLAGSEAPIISHVIALEHGWLLLGWMSGGSGYQSQEVIVVNESLKKTGKLSWFTSRGERGVLVRLDAGGWSVGIPEGTNEEAGLRINGAKVAMRFTDFATTDATWSYAAPGAEPMAAPKRVAWFRLSDRGFVVTRR